MRSHHISIVSLLDIGQRNAHEKLTILLVKRFFFATNRSSYLGSSCCLVFARSFSCFVHFFAYSSPFCCRFVSHIVSLAGVSCVSESVFVCVRDWRLVCTRIRTRFQFQFFHVYPRALVDQHKLINEPDMNVQRKRTNEKESNKKTVEIKGAAPKYRFVAVFISSTFFRFRSFRVCQFSFCDLSSRRLSFVRVQPAHIVRCDWLMNVLYKKYRNSGDSQCDFWWFLECRTKSGQTMANLKIK